MHSESERTKFTEATSETVMLMNQISKQEKKWWYTDLREIGNGSKVILCSNCIQKCLDAKQNCSKMTSLCYRAK